MNLASAGSAAAERRAEGSVDGAPPDTPLRRHQRLRDTFSAAADRAEVRAGRCALLQLFAFLGAAICGGTAIFEGGAITTLAASAFALAFLVVRGVQSRFIREKERAQTRATVHDRHVRRVMGDYGDLPHDGQALYAPDHPYAADLDLYGRLSLLQRVDVTHTRQGKETLAAWLGEPADAETTAARQRAVVELAGAFELRQELEASVLDTGREELDAGPFLEWTRIPGVIERRPYLRWVAPLLPLCSLGAYVVGRAGFVPTWAWLLPLCAQFLLVFRTDSESAQAFVALGSRRGFVEAYRNLFLVVETAAFDSEPLLAMRRRLQVGGAPPSVQMKRLDAWVSFYELRAQGLVHFLINPLLLWDLNCLIGIERWVARVGRGCSAWFDVLGEIEALSSLSVLYDQDAGATMPEIGEAGEALEAEGLGHPLVEAKSRVVNDVSLGGPGSCLIVTGSNMAGKSTLLRALGVNVALALAGGPVIARRMRVPKVRLRTSMRVADSLERGASYFAAELSRLRIVLREAAEGPPVLFLLDELLRGTNARARHLGGRAVVEHLLEAEAMGLVATHDIALSSLEASHPGRVQNVHFTDVMQEGEILFDYRLRPGVVRTSNALRLLGQLGIEVPEDADAGLTEAG